MIAPLDRVLALLRGDGCSRAFLRDQLGMSSKEVTAFLAELGARQVGILWHIPSAERSARAQARLTNPIQYQPPIAGFRINRNHKPCTGGSGST